MALKMSLANKTLLAMVLGAIIGFMIESNREDEIVEIFFCVCCKWR